MASKKQTRSAKSASGTKSRGSTARKDAKSGNYLSGYDWGRIIARAWKDPAFKKRVEANPVKAIRKFLGDKYKGVNILNIPPRPPDIDDGQLEDIVNGKHQMYHCSNLC